MSADSNHKTQCGRLLKLLLDPRGDWVSLSDILALNIAQYSARIHELRRLGFQIQNRTETINGKKCSWFRLVPNERQQSLALRKSVQGDSPVTLKDAGISGPEDVRYPD